MHRVIHVGGTTFFFISTKTQLCSLKWKNLLMFLMYFEIAWLTNYRINIIRYLTICEIIWRLLPTKSIQPGILEFTIDFSWEWWCELAVRYYPDFWSNKFKKQDSTVWHGVYALIPNTQTILILSTPPPIYLELLIL